MENLYDSIAKGNCILFLGAGASITSKHKYLSKDLIEFYTEIQSIPYDNHNNDIVDFVDKVFSISKYDRKDFDLRISNWLGRNLKIEDYHSKSVLIPWKLIITTNIDTLIEDSINMHKIDDTFHIIKNYNEFNQKIDTNKSKLIKIHGCISDIVKYPLLFSSKQFEDNNKFYNKIFSLLNQFSEEVTILFLGYSFSDRFGNLFLNKFQNNLLGRHHYLVSPQIDTSDFNLEYLKSKRITPIKTDFKSFIEDYYTWHEANKDKYTKKLKNRFELPNKTTITYHLSNQLEKFIIPINNSYNNGKIDPIQYYLGKEPNYVVIRDNLDVIKRKKTNEVKKIISEKFNKVDLDCSFVFLKGDYGTGKSTFSYRLIKEILNEDTNVLAFEIIDFNHINISLIKSLISSLKEVNKIIIYSDLADLEVNFTKLRELRGELNAEQYQDKNIILLQSIRINRIELFKDKFKIKNFEEININSQFNQFELEELLSKLSQKNIINLLDERSKQQLISELLIENVNDPLTIFLKIVKKGNHVKYIINAYNQFENSDTQKAFKYTCLLYQYGIKMPVGILKSLISTDYMIFKNMVLQSDGKDIFLQEEIKNDSFLEPDLYFKVKHKILAKSFVENFYKNNNTLFSDILNIVNNLSSNTYSVKLFISLIKEIKTEKIFDDSKINKLFENAFKRIGLDQQFLVYYTKDLQYRSTNKIKNLEKGIELIEEYEINEDLNREYYKRSEYLIHRKACLKIELSKLLYFEENSNYLNEFEEALELFNIKLSLSPNSIFSYRNYLKALIWYVETTNDELNKIVYELKILNLIDKAIENLDENGDEIIRMKEIYRNRINVRELLIRIDYLYERSESRPFALLMKIEYYKSINKDINEFVIEIENYTYIDEVNEFLFHFYGIRLEDHNYRIKFFEILKTNKSLIEKNKLNYLYYSFVAEFYNRNSVEAFDYQNEIRRLFQTSKLKKPLYFIDNESNEKFIFNGTLIKQGDYYNLKLTNFGQSINSRLNNKKYNIKELKDKEIKAYLYFDYTGIWAEII